MTRKLRRCILALLAVGIAGWILWATLHSSYRYRRPADKPDTVSLYDFRFKVTLSPSAKEMELHLLPELSDVKVSEKLVSVKQITNRDRSNPRRTFNLIQISEEDGLESIALSSGEKLRLLASGVRYPNFDGEWRESVFAAGETKPLSPEEVRKRGFLTSRRSETVPETWGGWIVPAYWFGIETEQQRMRFDYQGYWDAQTLREFDGGGGGHSTSGNRFNCYRGIRHWNDGPIYVVFDVASGAPVVVDVPAAAGNDADFGVTIARVLALESGKYEVGPRSEYVASNVKIQHFGIDRAKTETSTLILAVTNNRAGFAMDAFALNAAGEVLDADYALGNIQPVSMVTFDVPREEIATLRFQLLPHFDRIVYETRIPDMPRQNRGVTNLFNLRVPVLHIRSQTDFFTVLEDLAQVDGTRDIRDDVRFPPEHFPRTYRDVTANDLMREMNLYYHGEHRISVSQETFSLHQRKPRNFEQWLSDMMKR